MRKIEYLQARTSPIRALRRTTTAQAQREVTASSDDVEVGEVSLLPDEKLDAAGLTSSVHRRPRDEDVRGDGATGPRRRRRPRHGLPPRARGARAKFADRRSGGWRGRRR